MFVVILHIIMKYAVTAVFLVAFYVAAKAQ
jgi:hypothetical protein